MMSPAGGKHGILAARILRKLGNLVEDNKLGAVFAAETGFLLASNPDTVRAPDVAFVCRQRLDDVGPVTGYRPGAPHAGAQIETPGLQRSECPAKICSRSTPRRDSAAVRCRLCSPDRTTLSNFRSPTSRICKPLWGVTTNGAKSYAKGVSFPKTVLGGGLTKIKTAEV